MNAVALLLVGVSLGAMFLTANGATQDNAVGPLPKLPKPVGPNQYTGATLLPLEPPNYATRVRLIWQSDFMVCWPRRSSPNFSFFHDLWYHDRS